MFWEKKNNKKSLPELPPLKFSLPQKIIPKEEFSKSDFSFPELPEKENFQDVKDEFESEELPELPSKPEIPKIKGMNEFSVQKAIEISPAARTEDVYVKIDRFHSARKALNIAREKLRDIEELMRKLRETKMREEQELSSWEEEILSIKSKVEDVTKNIFEKVE